MKFGALRLKVRPESYGWLNAAAREVNYVWNWANATSQKACQPYYGPPVWLSAFDLNNLSSGSTHHFDHIGADVVNRVCGEYVAKRRAAKAYRLRWRISAGSRRSLGWVPFRAANIKRKGRSVRFLGKTIRVFEDHLLDDQKWRDGQFAQDAVGDWWLCLPVPSVATDVPAPMELVGIDLGLKDVATTSDGDRLPAARFYRDTQVRISQAQRRGHKRQAKRLHRKAARQRKDALHKFTTGIVGKYQSIIVGDVSSANLARTVMAKAVLDSGWSTLRDMLLYKGERAGRHVQIVREAYTTRACSECGALTGPQGLRGLVVSEWQCGDCGALHERDVNAARNIAKLGSRHTTSVRGNKSSSIEVAMGAGIASASVTHQERKL